MAIAAPFPERPLLGVALRCAAATSFAGMSAALKYASEHGASIDDLIFYRSLGGLPLVTAYALIQNGPTAFAVRSPLAHLTRSLVGVCAMILAFAALALLPIAEATTLTYSSPITATLLSALLLREAVGWRRWLAVVIGFGGVLLVAHPNTGVQLSKLGLVIGVAASFGQGAVAITLRQIGKTERPGAIVFWFLSFTTLCSGLALPWLGVRHGAGLTAILLGAGLFGGIAQLAVTASVRYAPVSIVVPFDYLQILWATMIGWFLFASPPPATMIAGAVLIAFSGIYTAYREGRRGLIPSEANVVPEA